MGQTFALITAVYTPVRDVNGKPLRRIRDEATPHSPLDSKKAGDDPASLHFRWNVAVD